jgi:hypothetical protein
VRQGGFFKWEMLGAGAAKEACSEVAKIGLMPHKEQAGGAHVLAEFLDCLLWGHPG